MDRIQKIFYFRRVLQLYFKAIHAGDTGKCAFYAHAVREAYLELD